MKTVDKYAWGAVCLGLAFAAGGYGSGAQDFFSGLLLNLSAEFVGFGAAFLVGTKLARATLQDRFAWLLPSLLNVIKQARVDGNITSATAQRSVIAVVTLLQERNPSADNDIRYRKPKEPCAVCGLESEVTEKPGKACCAQCGLRGSLWCNGQSPQTSAANPSASQH